MQLFLYNIGVRFFFLVSRALAPFHKRAALFLQSRNQNKNLHKGFAEHKGERVWFHCASLGEFEQAKPLIEMLKKESPDTKILLSFFSPSGFLQAQNYKFVDRVCYLPKDTKQNARDFIENTRPNKVIFVKYELWHYFINEVHNKGIPIFLLSAKLHSKGVMHPLMRSFYIKLLSKFNQIFAQDKKTLELLQANGIQKAVLSGDTRIDRVLEIKESNYENPVLASFKSNRKLIIAGSSWEKEENCLKEVFAKLDGFKLLIAPHDIARSKQVLERFKSFKSVLYSESQGKDLAECDVMIFDTMGHLSKAYRYADIALVGGGFANALHNIFEPAVYGIPVLFGNNHAKYSEAKELKSQGLASDFLDSEGLLNLFQGFEALSATATQKGKNFFDTQAGVCSKVYQIIWD